MQNWELYGHCSRKVCGLWRAYASIWCQEGIPKEWYFSWELKGADALTEGKEDGGEGQEFQAKGTACVEYPRVGRTGRAVYEETGWELRLARWTSTRCSEPLGPAKNSRTEFQHNEYPLKGLTWISVGWMLLTWSHLYLEKGIRLQCGTYVEGNEHAWRKTSRRTF